MATITIKNLSRSSALQLLKNVQSNAAKGIAISGAKECRYITTDTITATVKPDDSGWDGPDYENNTFEIYSNYWQESTLKTFINYN